MKIKINNRLFFFFNNFAVSRELDSVASIFSFVARYNPNNPSHRELFRPLSYPKIQVFDDNDKLLLTGKIIKWDFSSTENPELAKLSGYSTAGELEDCTIPYSAYPLESNNRSLKDIAEKLLQPFGLNLIIDPSVQNDANLIYKKSVASPTESVKNYLAKLAAQRNIVLSHDAKGNVVLFRPNIKAPVKLFLNKTNTDNMAFSVNGQSMHSEITVVRQPSADNKNLSPVDTVKNNLVQGFRPKVKTLSSGTDTDTSKAATNSVADELQNITLSVSIPRFEDVNPGDIVEVQNDEIYINNRTKFILKSVSLNQNEDKDGMTLSLVLPESFTGGTPKNIFA